MPKVAEPMSSAEVDVKQNPTPESSHRHEHTSLKPAGDTKAAPNDAHIEWEYIGHQFRHSGESASESQPKDRMSSEIPQQEQPKMWMPGDSYQYSFPKPEGDCWNSVLEEKLKSDTIKCEAWKDEVQNLLIFAGLFSAVVTAFIIESYKTLRPDPNDIVIYLLKSIASGSSASSPPTFTRAASTTRINICWFLSLILSLATVLVGIISLQWVREHQRYTDDITHRKSLAVFHMRTRGLDAWYVSRIFTALPLMLQCALIFFFLGVVDFLFALDFIVAVPVTAAIVLTLFFLIATTMLPTVQLFIPRCLDPEQRPDKASLPVQCPYRSPQAWIFYRCSSLVYRVVRKLAFSSSAVINRQLILYPYRFALSASKDYDFKSWISFDSWWLTIPEVHMTIPEAHSDSLPFSWVTEDPMYKSESLTRVVKMHPSQATLPTYMEAESLIDALRRYSSKYTTVCALYHCFLELTVPSGDLHENHKRNANTLFDLYYTQTVPEIRMGDAPFLPYCAPSRVLNTDLSDADALLAPPHPCTHDEQMIWFLGALWQYGYPQILKTHHASHLAELISRSTAYLLTKNRIIPAVNRNKYDPGLWHRNESAFPGTLEHSQFGQGIAKKVLDDSVTQFYLIFDSFIRQASEVTKNTSLLGTVFNEPPFLKKFCSIPSRLLGDAIRHPQAAGLYLPEIFQQTLSFISSTLDHAVKDGEPRPLLFVTASYILTDIFRDFQILDWDDKAGKIVTSFQKWNYDPVRSKPILSFMETLLYYFRRFPTMPGYYGAGDSAYYQAFTGGNIYVWHVTAKFELSRLNIHTPIHPLDSPTEAVMEEKRIQTPIVGITASISSVSSFPDLSDSVSIRADTDES